MNLKGKFIEEVLKIKESHFFRTSEDNLVGFWFKGIEGEALHLILKDSEIESTTESPCLKEYKEGKELTHEQAHGSLVIIWKGFDEKEVEYIVEEIKNGVKKLREISGWK